MYNSKKELTIIISEHVGDGGNVGSSVQHEEPHNKPHSRAPPPASRQLPPGGVVGTVRPVPPRDVQTR